jgi:hypothetical protein
MEVTGFADTLVTTIYATGRHKTYYKGHIQHRREILGYKIQTFVDIFIVILIY